MYVDKYEAQRVVEPVYKLMTFYGQLEHLFVIHFKDPDSLAPRKLLHNQDGDIPLQYMYIIAAMKRCNLQDHLSSELKRLGVHLYSNFGPLDVIDVTAVQALVKQGPDTQAKELSLTEVVIWCRQYQRALAAQQRDRWTLRHQICT
ncbi:hypothetical protein V5O48_011161 [Marasmius crinis-equi]|uniref:Uncharacterized protein n=1 Tax=Marasmius crinis-equi TaxID=585013 RepID=A0ABR3F6C1_9AGAR